MKYSKQITIASIVTALSSLLLLFYVWTRYQIVIQHGKVLSDKVDNYKGLLYSEMETCRTILGCYVDDQTFCATDAYTEKIIELGKKTEEYRTKIGEEVTTRPEDF